jgi:transposase-like protein
MCYNFYVTIGKGPEIMSQQKSMSLFEFQKQFNSEEACQEHLFNMRWPDGFSCPRCGCKKYYLISKRRLYQCQDCSYQASLTAGTIFHKTRTPLRKWFWAIFLVANDKRGFSALALKNSINVSYPTAWLMLQKIRAAMSDRDQLYQLSGLVQLDDAFFGGPNGWQGRGTEKTPVYVAVSTDNDGKPLYAKMKVVENINKNTALEFATRAISEGCTIITDGYTVYPQLKSHGYTHERVLSSDPEAEEKFRWVNALISNAKAFIVGTFHGLDKKHLQAYLDEFCYRFNRRKWQDQLFNRLLHACSVGPVVTYAELTL